MTVNLNCKCGWKQYEVEVEGRKGAEVLVDVHESKDIRRAYRHDARYEEVAR